LTTATIRRGDDFPSHATPVPQVDKPKPPAPHTRLADRTLTPAAAVDFGSDSSTGGNGKGKGWKGAHPRANGKDKPKHASKGHRPKPSQAANSNAPAAPPGQVKPGLNGRSAAAAAYGKIGEQG
jgi:hypothetical protein